MSEKSKKILKEVRLELLKIDKSISEVAREIGISRTAFYLAIKRETKSGKVYDWIKENIGIELKKTA
jgi:predicted DNA-binding protein YlxM (UPF0122 family)